MSSPPHCRLKPLCMVEVILALKNKRPGCGSATRWGVHLTTCHDDTCHYTIHHKVWNFQNPLIQNKFGISFGISFRNTTNTTILLLLVYILTSSQARFFSSMPPQTQQHWHSSSALHKYHSLNRTNRNQTGCMQRATINVAHKKYCRMLLATNVPYWMWNKNTAEC